MNKSGPIIVIDDDVDDQHLIIEIFKELNVKNEVLVFSNGHDAITFLTTSKSQPFLILSDINIPKLNGLELRDQIHNNEQLRLKCIPYLFFTTTSEQKMVIDAYSKSVQGFFVKPASSESFKRVLNNIVEYWKDYHSPKIIV